MREFVRTGTTAGGIRSGSECHTFALDRSFLTHIDLTILAPYMPAPNGSQIQVGAAGDILGRAQEHGSSSPANWGGAN